MFLGIFTIFIVIGVIIFLITSFCVAIFGGGPFVPTPMKAVHHVLKHAKIRKGQRVYDIGAGDGRFIHFATKDYGAVATGFEIDPFVYFLAKFRQKFFGWKGKMIRSSFLKHNLKDADVIICYMLPNTLAKYQEKFQKELKKGAKIVSYAFHVGTLKPKEIIPKQGKISRTFIYEI